MPRKPRIHLEGGFYHIMLRGNAGQNIFFENEDREIFYELLKEGTLRYGYFVHGFCLMSNHVHLLLQQGSYPLSKPMQNISFRYARYVNKHQKRVGHLFQGRFRAILVEKESYLLQLLRYIHLNPVKAKITRSLDDYKWSSHHAYLGLQIIPWLTVEFILSQFSQDLYSARKIYLDFVQQGLFESFCMQFPENSLDTRILGSDVFTKKIISLEQNGSLFSEVNYSIEQVIDFVSHKFDINYECLRGKSRHRKDSNARFIVVWLCYTLGICTITKISKLLNRDPTHYMRSLRNLTDHRVKELEKLRFDFLQKIETM